jgi:hypothetical protein
MIFEGGDGSEEDERGLERFHSGYKSVVGECTLIQANHGSPCDDIPKADIVFAPRHPSTNAHKKHKADPRKAALHMGGDLGRSKFARGSSRRAVEYDIMLANSSQGVAVLVTRAEDKIVQMMFFVQHSPCGGEFDREDTDPSDLVFCSLQPGVLQLGR